VSGGEFLQALIHDPSFGWLAPLTRLIARLDELEQAEAEVAQPEDPASVLASIRALLSPRPAGSEFHRRYAERIDQDPDLAIAHGMVMAEMA
jgi:hypothetical protein